MQAESLSPEVTDKELMGGGDGGGRLCGAASPSGTVGPALGWKVRLWGLMSLGLNSAGRGHGVRLVLSVKWG